MADLCPSCCEPLPPRRSRGPAPTYCSPRCRQAAFRQRRTAAALEGAAIGRAETSPFIRVAPSMGQAEQAIKEARGVAGALLRLGRDARPQLAWRFAKTGVALRDALERYFPEIR